MIRKEFDTSHKPCARITFIVPETVWADKIHLVGDFNSWNPRSHPMRRTRDGRWLLTLELDMGREYQYRYLCDGEYWMTEYPAEGYADGPDGRDNCLVTTSPPEKLEHPLM